MLLSRFVTLWKRNKYIRIVSNFYLKNKKDPQKEVSQVNISQMQKKINSSGFGILFVSLKMYNNIPPTFLFLLEALNKH